MSSLNHDFYVQPMLQVYVETIAMYAIWTIVMLLLSKKARKVAGIIGAAFAAGLILLFTVSFRNGGEARDVSLIPFISFVNAKFQPEFYRTLYMNILLFVPLGLSLPFALSGKIKHCILITIAIGMLLSVGVEAAQYFFRIGRCETDDVIMNTLGVIFGTTSYLICIGIDRLRNRTG